MELEELERRFPRLMEEAKKAYTTERLRQLRERDKADVKLVQARVQRYIEKHRDTVNARRRQKRESNRVHNAGEAATLIKPAEPIEGKNPPV
jgi:hypothetical protein